MGRCIRFGSYVNTSVVVPAILHHQHHIPRLCCLSGVRRPTAMPRVSEHMPEIVAYIVAIVDKGLAYAASGSVYFDTVAFE